MGRKSIKFLCIVFLVCLTVEQIIVRDLHFVAIGFLKKEEFFEGRPTCYWKLQVERYQIAPTVTEEGTGPPYGQKKRPIGRNIFLVISNYIHYFHESLPDKPAILLGKPNSVPVLAQLLDQDNLLVSREACKTLRLLASEHDDEALTALKVALGKERPWVRLSAGRALLDVDPEYEELLPVAIECLRHPWYRNVGACLVTEIAKVRFEEALAADRDNLVALRGLARCQRSLGEWEDALATLDRLILLDPQNSGAYSHYGQMPLEGANPAEALELLKMALSLDLERCPPTSKSGGSRKHLELANE